MSISSYDIRTPPFFNGQESEYIEFADNVDYMYHKENGLPQDIIGRRNENKGWYDNLRARLRAETTTWEQELILHKWLFVCIRYQSSKICTTAKDDMENGVWSEWQEIQHVPSAVLYLNFRLPHISPTFHFFLVFSFALSLYIGPYTSITTHFLGLPLLSFSMIRLSTIYHWVQPFTMQFVYAEATHLKNMGTYMFEKMYQDMVKLLRKLWQFIFPMIDVKCVLLQNFLYLLSRRIFRAPHFANRKKVTWSHISSRFYL